MALDQADETVKLLPQGSGLPSSSHHPAGPIHIYSPFQRLPSFPLMLINILDVIYLSVKVKCVLENHSNVKQKQFVYCVSHFTAAYKSGHRRLIPDAQ